MNFDIMADCCVSYKNIPYYSDLILDYLDEKESLRTLYNRFPSLENLKKQVNEKKETFSQETRKVLVSALKNQYRNITISEKTAKNISHLKEENTFTITTGHQLNLFTGPLYFFYKIISVINLTVELKQAYPEYNFVPIFWMASEDHDFEEINFFNFKEKQICWESDKTGAVGEFPTHGLSDVYDLFKEELNLSEHSETLKNLFKGAYLNCNNLTEATHFLANEIFKDYGLVILDGNDKDLKGVFAPYIKDELLKETAFQKVGVSAEKLNELGYKIQVNPRKINLFYLNKNIRERIVKEGNQYFIHNTEIQFSEKEILEELEKYPERFSPNAIMRPLFQEVVLPNLCYVGGSGELAYWLELKNYFDTVEVVFPSLLMRNSALLLSEKQAEKRQKLNLSNGDLFLKQKDLIVKQTKRISDIPIDFSPQKGYLQKQFMDLYDLAKKTDPSFLGAVAAQEKKQKNGLDHLEKRLLKAQKRKLRDELSRSIKLQDDLFPNGNLQERTTNFSEFYEVYGKQMIPVLFRELEPLNMKFNVITL